jgi:outer membrane lipoprotein-sorting protein
MEPGTAQSVHIALKTIQNKFEYPFPTMIELNDDRLSQRIKVTISKIETQKPVPKALFRPSFRPGVKIIQMDTD